MKTKFIPNNGIDTNKVFLVHRSELESRLDPFYYKPEFMELEAKIKKISNKKLRDFIKKMAGGATPTITEREKYYAEENNGIPFIRVQNLSTSGRLNLADIKNINLETHNAMLRRSQVDSGDLLVKITGVGRMAISSVAPDNFVGNINQHIVRIKTDDKHTSEVLAAYLNTDIGERLASRRSTGGTRPALDYPALRSIPVIYNPKIANRAYELKAKKEAEAQRLLDSIDDYLLSELGIKIPEEKKNRLEDRMFISHGKRLYDNRYDPFYHQEFFESVNGSVINGLYNCHQIKNIIYGNLIKGYLPKDEEKEGECKVVQISAINSDGTINVGELLTAKDIFFKDQKLQQAEILVVITGATIGKIGYWNKTGEYYLGGDIIKFKVNKELNPYYVFSYLRTQPAQIEIKRNITGATNGHLSPYDFKHILIPVPPTEKQNKIASTIMQIREKVFSLQKDALIEVEKAKREMERIILGEP